MTTILICGIAGLSILFINVFVKSFALDLASTACFAGVAITAGSYWWIQVAGIILMSSSLVFAVNKFGRYLN